jgi:hypothetical protein
MIEAWANGQRLANVFDELFYGNRYVGVFATAYEDHNLDIRFDNFIVESLTCGGGALTSQENLPLHPNWNRARREGSSLRLQE